MQTTFKRQTLSCYAQSKDSRIRKLKKAWVVRKVQPDEFQAKLKEKFNKEHDVDLVERDDQLFLDILFQKPNKMTEYKKKIGTIVTLINKWGIGHNIYEKLDAIEEPPQVIEVEDGMMLELNISVALDIHSSRGCEFEVEDEADT